MGPSSTGSTCSPRSPPTFLRRCQCPKHDSRSRGCSSLELQGAEPRLSSQFLQDQKRLKPAKACQSTSCLWGSVSSCQLPELPGQGRVPYCNLGEHPRLGFVIPASSQLYLCVPKCHALCETMGGCLRCRGSEVESCGEDPGQARGALAKHGRLAGTKEDLSLFQCSCC